MAIMVFLDDVFLMLASVVSFLTVDAEHQMFCTHNFAC